MTQTDVNDKNKVFIKVQKEIFSLAKELIDSGTEVMRRHEIHARINAQEMKNVILASKNIGLKDCYSIIHELSNLCNQYDDKQAEFLINLVNNPQNKKYKFITKDKIKLIAGTPLISFPQKHSRGELSIVTTIGFSGIFLATCLSIFSTFVMYITVFNPNALINYTFNGFVNFLTSMNLESEELMQMNNSINGFKDDKILSFLENKDGISSILGNDKANLLFSSSSYTNYKTVLNLSNSGHFTTIGISFFALLLLSIFSITYLIFGIKKYWDRGSHSDRFKKNIDIIDDMIEEIKNWKLDIRQYNKAIVSNCNKSIDSTGRIACILLEKKKCTEEIVRQKISEINVMSDQILQCNPKIAQREIYKKYIKLMSTLDVMNDRNLNPVNLSQQIQSVRQEFESIEKSIVRIQKSKVVKQENENQDSPEQTFVSRAEINMQKVIELPIIIEEIEEVKNYTEASAINMEESEKFKNIEASAINIETIKETEQEQEILANKQKYEIGQNQVNPPQRFEIDLNINMNLDFINGAFNLDDEAKEFKRNSPVTSTKNSDLGNQSKETIVNNINKNLTIDSLDVTNVSSISSGVLEDMHEYNSNPNMLPREILDLSSSFNTTMNDSSIAPHLQV